MYEEDPTDPTRGYIDVSVVSLRAHGLFPGSRSRTGVQLWLVDQIQSSGLSTVEEVIRLSDGVFRVFGRINPCFLSE